MIGRAEQPVDIWAVASLDTGACFLYSARRATSKVTIDG